MVIKIAPKIAFDASDMLGECPRWSREECCLYWVDIAQNTLRRLDPATGLCQSRMFDQPVGCFAFRRSCGLILAMKDGFATITDMFAPALPFGDAPLLGNQNLRFNDGRTDRDGNFWVGSVNTAKSAHNAALYKLRADGRCEFIEGGMLTANGASFSADGTRFVHTDTPSHALRSYDVIDGCIKNPKILHQFPIGEGRPDGGSYDADGYYWSALFDGGKVVRLSPDGDIVATVELPVSRPTMIAFGGVDLRTAYVTTARIGLSAAALLEQRGAGALLTFRVEVPGLPEYHFG